MSKADYFDGCMLDEFFRQQDVLIHDLLRIAVLRFSSQRP